MTTYLVGKLDVFLDLYQSSVTWTLQSFCVNEKTGAESACLDYLSWNSASTLRNSQTNTLLIPLLPHYKAYNLLLKLSLASSRDGKFIMIGVHIINHFKCPKSIV